MKSLNLEVKDLGKCPCGAQLYGSVDPPAVAHSMPYCAEFNRMEPDEFLTYVRRSRGIPDSQPMVQS